MEKRYFLFGGVVCGSYDNNEHDNVIQILMDGDGDLYCFDGYPEHLLSRFMGWDSFQEITDVEYNFYDMQIKELEKIRKNIESF